MVDVPLAYFITIRTYGTWLHGDERGSVDREHHKFDTELIAADERRWLESARSLAAAPFVFDDAMRQLATAVIHELFSFRQWKEWALNVRTNHIHFVVTSRLSPERVMNDVKARVTRRLREEHLLSADASVWTRHGSTQYLWQPSDLDGACRYVMDCQ